MTTAAATPLWQRYWHDGDEEARSELILGYWPLVPMTRARVFPHPEPTYETADLEGDGVLGLVRAVDQYRVGAGRSFTSYAILLIRYALMDYARRADLLPRKACQERRAGQQNGTVAPGPLIVSLDTTPASGSDESGAPLFLKDTFMDPAPGPEAEALASAGRAALWEEVEQLPPDCASLLAWYYAPDEPCLYDYPRPAGRQRGVERTFQQSRALLGRRLSQHGAAVWREAVAAPQATPSAGRAR